jgi:hypothetical protein
MSQWPTALSVHMSCRNRSLPNSLSASLALKVGVGLVLPGAPQRYSDELPQAVQLHPIDIPMRVSPMSTLIIGGTLEPLTYLQDS